MYVGSQTLMKKYDQCLLELGYSIEELVDKASDCLSKHMEKYNHIVLLCGPGNNGADGLSLALKLHQMNKDVLIYIFEDKKRSQANQYYLELCYENNIQIDLIEDMNIDNAICQMKYCDVIVDAMFGFGLKNSPRGIYQSIIEEVNQLYDQDIIAVDIPTGLDCNSGRPYQSVVCATHTITLSAIKNGFLNPDSVSFTGKVILEQLDVQDVSQEAGLYQLVDFKYASSLMKERMFDGHKGCYGRVGMITGCLDYKGASLLSTKSAVYSGSGVVTAITCEEVINNLTSFCPEATTSLRPPIFQKQDLNTYDALLIGSGLGLSLDAYRYVADVMSLSLQPLVIDGDALTILSSQLDLLKKQKRTIVLTPHLGEFQRLCPFEKNDDLLSIASSFAKQWNVVLVLKGPYTMVTNGKYSYRILAGNKAMSTGGMGDVLAGIITSLLGQGYNAMDASLLGVYIHGICGDEIAKQDYTVIASRVIEYIPCIMKMLLDKENDL